MIQRISYAFRETIASFRRNVTLSMAAVITSAVSLLLVGATFLMQRAFDNLLVQWRGDVGMIVFVRPDVTPEALKFVEQNLKSQPNVIDVDKLAYLDKAASFEEAKRVFAGDTTTLSLLSIDTIPSQFKVVPKTTDPELVRSLADQYRTLPGVAGVSLAEDEFDVISTLSGFVRTVTIAMSLVLLAVAVILIWNTIRTAIFARRREIEVMKLVGATDWFIRVPFIMEGLIQGLVGAMVSCVGLWTLNSAWTSGVAGFKAGTGVSSLVVPDSYLNGVMIALLIIGATAGGVGSGVASSKFLDV
ncbi:MAG: FtsX-like permease family protein [Actinobacteria bacterium]|uniref:Cell division protein FtsX n=1 Tax=freshwater metagenome TaxID=449393 RepID=A0A6J7T1M7_9ZZZZ|nr:FtsX-like permease family protein [Actinomycetota bacterium]